MATGAEREQSPVTLVAYLVFVLAASAIVYSFVSVAREGETRRRCTPVCLLKPEYAGANRRAPDFTLKDLEGKGWVRLSYGHIEIVDLEALGRAAS